MADDVTNRSLRYLQPDTRTVDPSSPSVTGTAGADITPPPPISATETEAMNLTADIGFDRRRARMLNQDFEDLHQRSQFVEWRTRTTARGRASTTEMLDELAELGFAWRDVARLVGVSVPAVQKWRRGERASGERRRQVASLLAACDLIADHYQVREIASWFEMPLVADVPVAPMDLYIGKRPDLVFEHASGYVDPEQILTQFDGEWRQRYRSDFEVFRADDGDLSIRPKAQ
jgi:transcriptional regulator with XRE-family HTH domain